MGDVELWADSPEATQTYYLRMGGMSFDDIAQQLQMTVDQAIKLYREKVTQAAQIFSEDQRQQIIQLELDRLDALQQPYWIAATSGELKAGEFVLKIMQQRAKYLQLDQAGATTESQISRVLVVGGTQAEFVEALMNGRNQSVAGPSSEDGDDSEED